MIHFRDAVLCDGHAVLVGTSARHAPKGIRPAGRRGSLFLAAGMSHPGLDAIKRNLYLVGFVMIKRR